STVVPNIRIFAAALYDFVNVTFPEFAELNANNRSLCISNCYLEVSLIESTYRAARHFPNDLDTYFSSYTTIGSETLMDTFFNDCPYEINVEDAKNAARMNIRRTKCMNREPFHRVNPDDVEF
ncbi:hypothetical protein PMAYCL1PPCAC_04765, partial [Pristionchus mayeri]